MPDPFWTFLRTISLFLAYLYVPNLLRSLFYRAADPKSPAACSSILWIGRGLVATNLITSVLAALGGR
jgi:hypothetical protein